jgi:hypothetical protein
VNQIIDEGLTGDLEFFIAVLGTSRLNIDEVEVNSGGPIAISIGRPLVDVFVLCVALAMVQTCSVYPCRQGL